MHVSHAQGLPCTVVLFLYCFEGTCPREQGLLTSCWCSVLQAVDPGTELHLRRGKVPFSCHKNTVQGLL